MVTGVEKRLVGEVKQLRSEQLLILVANKVKQIAAASGVGWGVPRRIDAPLMAGCDSLVGTRGVATPPPPLLFHDI